MNGVKDASETDVDCGGPECPICIFNQGCARNADCNTNTCANGVCQSHCFNQVRDLGEADVDCGGSLCGPCLSGRKCNSARDCASQSCAAGFCQ